MSAQSRPGSVGPPNGNMPHGQGPPPPPPGPPGQQSQNLNQIVSSIITFQVATVFHLHSLVPHVMSHACGVVT